MTRRTTLALAALAVAGSAAAAPHATAQTTVIDEGTFRVDIRGSAIGTETFTIRRSGAGANATTVAQGRIVLDTGEQTRTVLQFRGQPLSPAAFQIEVTGDRRQSVTGRAAGSRFRTTLVSDASERMREFLVEPGAVILDDATAHQHYFLALRADDPGTIPVILPRQSRQVTARIEDRGTETIQIAGQQVTARLLAIRIDGLNDRSVWIDTRGRVLQISVPAQDLTARRTALP